MIGTVLTLARVLVLAASVSALLHPTVAGVASFYRWHPGEAAAGPALRHWLGPHWRGQSVTVSRAGRSVTVILTDTCQCYEGTATERIIDLDRRSFAVLASPSRGLAGVTIASSSSSSGR